MSSTTPQGPGGPEYIESGGGTPVAPESGGHRRALLGGGAVAGLLVIGGAAWAATSFFATGDQPAQALPASTIAYASVDLDPSGGQKVEAIQALRKFPAFREEIGLETDDDLRERLFTELAEDGECEGLDYAEDVEPWLGQRAAVAAVDTGEEQPAPVVVLQVTDAGAADEGLATLRDACAGGADGQLGWAVEGDWALLAESDEIAGSVADAAADGTLADDGTYQRWVDEAGDPGVVSMYAAPAAGAFLAELAQSTPMTGMGTESPGVDPTTSSVPDEVRAALEDFQGAAVTVRFDDGALEAEMATETTEQLSPLLGSEAAGEAVTSLPEDTVAAYGMSFSDGWFTKMLEQMSASSGMSAEEMSSQLSAMTGLDLPADAETLTGEAAAVSLGSGLDLDAVANGGPAELPVAVKIQGDPAEIEEVLDKLRSQLPADQAELLEAEVTDDVVVLGPDADYRGAVAEGGSLGDSDAFSDVVPEGDEAMALAFVDFDADDDWLVRLAGEQDPEVADNLEPLSALGISAWAEDEVSHGLVRLTTDD